MNVEDLPPAVSEAFTLAYPNVDLQSLDGLTADELSGYMNAWQGKLFELVVRNELNAGEVVGGWHLEPGQTAELAASATQPGWDLAIVDTNGEVVHHLQLKATDSVSYIQEALDRYPDIPVIATADQAEALAHLDGVSTADISTGDLIRSVDGGQLAEDGLAASDVLMPGTVIAATEILAVISGRKTWDQAFEDGGSRLGISAAAGVAGALVATVFGGPLGAAAAIALRYWLAKEARHHQQVKQSAGTYPEKLLKRSKYNNADAVDAAEVVRQSGEALAPWQLEWLKSHYPPKFEFSSDWLYERFWTREKGNQIWVGQIEGTGAVLLYDPLIQVLDDDVVWVFSIQQECLRPFLRKELRPKLVKFKDEAKVDKFTSTYMSWMRGCFFEALKHIESYANDSGVRPAFSVVSKC